MNTTDFLLFTEMRSKEKATRTSMLRRLKEILNIIRERERQRFAFKGGNLALGDLVFNANEAVASKKFLL